MRLTQLITALGLLLAARGLADDMARKSKYSQYDIGEKPELMAMVGKQVGANDLEKAKKLLVDGVLSPIDQYTIQRFLIRSFEAERSTAEVNKLCQDVKILEDDYEILSICTLNSDAPISSKMDKVESFFEKSIQDFKGTHIPTSIAQDLLNLSWKMNDIARARRVYERAVLETSAESSVELRHLKERISSIYILPTNSKKTIEEGIRILDELESYYRSHPEDSENLDSVIYNKGLTRMLAFGDYAGMIHDFQRISGSFFGWTDAQIFSALAYVRIGERGKAKALLAQVSFVNYGPRDRIPFLQCFMAIIREELKESADFSPCVQLQDDTQSEVIIYITQELSKKNLAHDIEMALWRQFWRFYSSKILKKINEQSDIFINSIELQRAKSDSMIKSLELKNFQLLKVILVITAAALFLSFIFFLRLRSRSQKIEKLQTYIHKSVLARFLPPMIVEEIIQGKSRIDSKPHEMLITVIFCDLVGFTALSEKVSAATVSEILNRFMNSMTQVVYKHEGTIDKFIGDAAMVIFGAPMPLSGKEQAMRAVACSQDMLCAMNELNQAFELEFQQRIAMRVGIHQGNAIVGTFGNEKRSDFTAVGLTVNMASRIEAKAQPNEILMSPQVARYLASDQFQARGEFELRGIAGLLQLYAVVHERGPGKGNKLSS